jgi:hypothetical protein
MRAFLIKDIADGRQYIRHLNEPEDFDRALEYFEKGGGFIFPRTNYNSYEDIFLLELSHNTEDGLLSILSLANILFMIEIYTLDSIKYRDACVSAF